LRDATRRAAPRFRPGRTGSTIKHDGYRLIVQREGKQVRLWTRNDYDWSSRSPRIVEAASRVGKIGEIYAGGCQFA
jgi:ATP-dependent DNA ligase